jgi:hypothetical protein
MEEERSQEAAEEICTTKALSRQRLRIREYRI